MNQSPKQREVRHIINENNLSVCAILESHVASSRIDKLCSRVFKNWNWTSNDAVCVKGSRIILGWNSDDVVVDIISQEDQVMHARIFFKADKKELFCSFIYAHNRYTHRRSLWRNLNIHKLYVRGRPWCLLGDFNVALHLDDKAAGSSSIDIAMRDFQECVEDIEVTDVNSSGLRYTWNQKPKGADGILKKIDRIMANMEFNDIFVGSSALFQPYRISDHSPAILRIPMLTKIKPKPFKFSNILIHNTRFKDVVHNSWQMDVSGFWMFKVVQKLKFLKKPLRKLLYDQGNLHENVKHLRHKLDEAQRALDADPFNLTIREDEAAYLQAFNDALLTEECFLKQKAKIEWLRVGDSNTAYFHKVVKSRASRNRIDSITTPSGTCIDGDQVPMTFIDHYMAFLGQKGDTHPFNSSDLFCNKLSDNVANHMIRVVSSQEVRDAIFSMGNDKSPGPDGYTAAFFKEAWDIIAHDVIKAVQEFFINGSLLKELNHTIIALIPKVAFPLKINGYRPISCCNILFKCISKIISNRMKDSLATLISSNQSAFVPGRRITDNILLTQELMHNYHLDRGPPRCAFKVDIQKAYDTVDWGFLHEVLIGFGFHPRMIGWIMECVTSTSFSISINGSLHGYFKGKRGLRQGDPISPYLFTLVMEVLTLMLRRKVSDSDSFTYHHHCSDLNIINLCFADDLFLFAHGDVNSARVIMEALDEFKYASGLVPSLPKSTAYFCNVLNYVKLDILNVLPFEEGKLPVKYLGVPLVSTRLIYRDCKELVENVKSKINDWKNKFLSFAGRVQLVQSVLASMHIYWASVFIIPSRTLLDLEQLMRGFVWSQGDMRRGRAKVAWEAVCLPKHEGGLGLRKLNVFNTALISTHIWSIISLKESLWVKWIHVYKLRGRNFWDISLCGNMSWGWRKILQVRPLIRQFIWYRLGDGNMVSAWFDRWCLLSPLSDLVTPRDIHRAGFDMSTKVHDVIINGNWKWPNDWLVKYPPLYTIPVPSLVPNSLDRLIWKSINDVDSGFSVATVWECIRPRGEEIDWYDLVWFSHNIPRHAIHLWLVIKRKLKTQDKLRQWDVSSNTNLNLLQCPLCKRQPDSHDHLFFECIFSLQVWSQLQVFTGVPNMPSSLDLIVDILKPISRKRSARNVIVKLVFAASCYFIWQERNNRLFKNQKRSEDQVIEVIKSTVRLKLLSCKFKKTKKVEFFMHLWKLPSSLIRSSH
ncbi:putative RNA-directed DNA polymerase [Tanacetum coccineum]